MGGADSEVLLCDTSYVSQVMKAERRPDAIEHWPREAVERITTAILTISVITVAEIRTGMTMANWGPRLRADAEHRLAAYTWIPLDSRIIDQWSEIHAQATRGGLGTPNHNDIWIGATGVVRGYPLVSCDALQCELPRVCDSVIYLKTDPSSREVRLSTE